MYSGLLMSIRITGVLSSRSMTESFVALRQCFWLEKLLIFVGDVERCPASRSIGFTEYLAHYKRSINIPSVQDKFLANHTRYSYINYHDEQNTHSLPRSYWYAIPTESAIAIEAL